MWGLGWASDVVISAGGEALVTCTMSVSMKYANANSLVPPAAMCSQYVVIVAKKKKTRKPHSESCSAHATCSQGQRCRLGIRVNGKGQGYGKVLAMRRATCSFQRGLSGLYTRTPTE